MNPLKLVKNLLSVVSPAHTWLVMTLRRAKKVGEDCAGNRYYRAKPGKGRRREMRFVIYGKNNDPSSIQPEWHGWLHHQCDEIPSDDVDSYRRKWQIARKGNMLGTDMAYKGKNFKKGKARYVAWSPK